MPWILVNKVDSKMRVTSGLHNKWKTDCGRDDENMKIVANIENDNALQIFLIKESTKNPVD